MKLFLTIVNGFKPLTIVVKNSILYITGLLDSPLILCPNHLPLEFCKLRMFKINVLKQTITKNVTVKFSLQRK